MIFGDVFARYIEEQQIPESCIALSYEHSLTGDTFFWAMNYTTQQVRLKCRWLCIAMIKRRWEILIWMGR